MSSFQEKRTTQQLKPLLIFIVGSTATGKTEFSLLAKKQIENRLATSCEVINFDSVQVFRGIDIGTAKPSLAQRAQAVHHLIDFVPKGESFTAGEFRRDAMKVLKDRSQAGVGAFLLVGGSGFYAQALEKGMFEIEPVNPAIRRELEQQAESLGLPALYIELTKIDPDYAATIAVQDTYRILRGLEIVRSQNKTLTQIKNEFAAKPSELHSNYEIAKIGIRVEREVLRERIAKRTDRMLAQGWIDEVRTLRAEGLAAWSPMQSVGYKEIQSYLDGELQESELREKVIVSTMQLAKRQVTWFKRDTGGDHPVRWCPSEPEFSGALDQVTKLLLEKSTR